MKKQTIFTVTGANGGPSLKINVASFFYRRTATTKYGNGSGTVILGLVIKGEIKKKQLVKIKLPNGLEKKDRVLGIEINSEEVPSAKACHVIGICLEKTNIEILQ